MLELAQGNDEAARAAFQDGANLGHRPAITKLGKMMVDGRGGPIDIEGGMSLLGSAAQQGHIMARIELAEIAQELEKNFIKRILMKLKSLIILRDIVTEAKKEDQSPNLYEFY